jgi:signal transduction histidine kinase
VALRSELHKIIGFCAALALLVIGGTAWWEARRVHLVGVEARGRAMALQLARACEVSMSGPNPEEDLHYLLENVPGDEEHQTVSAAVYDVKDSQWVARQGATSRDVPSSEDPLLSAVLETDVDDNPGVISFKGEQFDRRGPEGEAILEFAAPILDRNGRRRGVVTLALAREPKGFLFVRTIVFMVLVAGAVVGVLWGILYKMLKGRILNPIQQLSDGIKRVRGGDLSARVESTREDEIGTLTNSFNDLISVLVERDSLQKRLEEAKRVEEAHRRLNEAHQKLQQAQEQLILTEKHASLGRLVHGLNHELNNPLSAARNMIPPLEAAITSLRERLSPPPPPPPKEDEDPTPRTGTPGEVDLEETTPLAPTPAPELLDDEETVATPATEAPLYVPSDPEQPAGDDEPTARTEVSEAPEPVTDLGPEPEPEPAVPVDVTEDLEDVSQAVDVIGRSVTRAINIVRDLGHFSKLSTADLEEVELRSVIEDAIAACQIELGPDARVEVAVDVPEVDGEPLRLKAFPSLLTQVFVNLITNSAQAIEGVGRIKIWARSTKERVTIHLEDNGPGISREHLHKVFEPFFTTKEQGKGTGLGLSICLGVVEKHGGTIEARRSRRGAYFVAELPLEPLVEPTDPFKSTSFLTASASAVNPA